MARAGSHGRGCHPTRFRVSRSVVSQRYPRQPRSSLRRSCRPAIQSSAMSKRRRILKWTGAVLCVLILGAWVAGTFWVVSWVGRRSVVYVDGRRINWRLFHPTTDESSALAIQRFIDMEGGWHCEKHDALSYAASYWLRFVMRGRMPAFTDIEVPLWLPFLLVTLPTGFMFWRDRKRLPSGHCSTCGYNLTGAEHERCPECGVACEPCGAEA